ncbi:MAG: response regulator, partial [Anaerolineales bacterium]|nr:response regulator [Anaerolineales bacterium]
MSGARVLVADDDPDYLRLMSGHLRKRGYEVESADGGQAALERLRQAEAFSVLVTDLMMPGMDGYELLRRARTQDAFIEVIVISGVGSLESAISSMRENGAFDYLTKPLEKVTDLSLAVERAVAHRALRLERAQLQAQIQAERERLRSLLTNASDAILSADGSGVVVVANPQAARLLGTEHLVGQRSTVVFPAPLRILLEHWMGASPQRAMVCEVPWPAEQVHLVSLTPLEPSGLEGGVGWVMVLQDISHLKHVDSLKMRLLTETAENIRRPLAAAFASLMALNDLPEARTEGFTARMDNLVGQLSA